MKLSLRARNAPAPALGPSVNDVPGALNAEPCPHTRKRTVRWTRYRVRSLGLSFGRSVCADCGALMRRKSLKL